MSELRIPEDLQKEYAIAKRAPNVQLMYGGRVGDLIERIARAEDALVTLAKQHAQSGYELSRLKDEAIAGPTLRVSADCWLGSRHSECAGKFYWVNEDRTEALVDCNCSCHNK